MKKLLVLTVVLFASTMAQVQQIVVTIGGYIVNFNRLPVSTVTYSIDSVTATAGTAVLNISIATSRMPPAGLQFDLLYPSTVTALTVTAGPVSTAASKAIACNVVSAGDERCIVSGVNQNTIANGVAAIVSATVTAGSTITISAPVTASVAGTALTSVLNPAIGSIAVPPVVSSVTCVVPAWDSSDGNPAGTYDIEPGEVTTCTVTLSQPAGAGGFSAAVTAGAPGLAVPPSIVVPSGSSTITFTVAVQ